MKNFKHSDIEIKNQLLIKCSIAMTISPVVILSSDTHVARFTTHLGTDSGVKSYN
jgi:hypothetical protein